MIDGIYIKVVVWGWIIDTIYRIRVLIGKFGIARSV